MSDASVDEDRAAKAARAKALLKSRQKKKAGVTPGSSGSPAGLSSLRHSTLASASQDGSSYAPSETADDNRSEASFNVNPQVPDDAKPSQQQFPTSPAEEARPSPVSQPPARTSSYGDASGLFSSSQQATGFRSASSLFGGDEGPIPSSGPTPGEIALSKSELERTRAELEDVRAQLLDAQSRVESGKAAIKAAESAARRAREETMVMEEGVKRTTEELRKAGLQIEEMREDQRTAREDASAAYEAVRATETNKRQIEEELGKVKHEIEGLKNELAVERNAASKTIGELRTELEAANSLSSQRQSTISLLVDEKSSLSSQLAYFEGLEARSQDTDRQLEESRALAEKLNARVTELEANLRSMASTSEELTNKEREASDRARELERLSNHSTRTISDLQAELKDQRARVRELEEQIQADDRVDVLERRLKSMQDRSEELEEKFNKSKQVAAKLKTERDSLESKYNAAEERSVGLEQNLARLQAEFDLLTTEHSALNVARNSLESAQSELNTRLGDLERRLEQAAKDAQNADAAHSDTTQKLNEALALAARGASTESAMATLQAENEGLLANLAEMRPKIVELTEAKLTLGELVEARDKSVREYEAQIKALENELAELHAQADDSGKHRAEVKAHVSSLEGQLEREKTALSESYTAYEELQTRMALVEQKLTETESSRGDLIQRAEKSEARVTQLDADLERRAREVTSLLEEVEARTRETIELRSFLERSRTDLDTANGEILAREDELSRLRLNGSKSPAQGTATLAGETMELELSTMRSRIRALEAEAFDAHAREHALQRQLANIQDGAKLPGPHTLLGVEGMRSMGEAPGKRGPSTGDLENMRTRPGSARALTPSNAARVHKLSVLDASLAPETRRKRAVSLNMLRARIISEMDSGASGVSPNIRLTNVGEESLLPSHTHDGVAGTSNLVGGDDEAHVFWCSACEGELVVFDDEQAPTALSNDQLAIKNDMSSELRYTANTQLEHLHARYTGTGHADITKYEWLTHQHRDTCASIVGHPPLATYLSIADGEATGRVRFEMIERMLQPCGPPPPKDDD